MRRVITSLARYRVDLLLLVVAAAWGSTYLVTKELVGTSSVVAMLAARMLLAVGLMAGILVAKRARPNRSELRSGAILGVLLSVVFALETFGIAHTSATNAGLIISLTIILTPILESVVMKRRLSVGFFLAATTATLGIALLVGNGVPRPPSLGDLLVLAAAAARAVHVTVMHKLAQNGLTRRRPAGREPVDSLRLTTVQLVICAVVFSGISLFHGEPIPHYLGSLGTGGIVLFAYLVVLCTVFAFVVQTWAVRRTSPSRVSLLLGTEPVGAAIVGLAIAHDGVGLVGCLGIVLVLAGIAWGRIVERPGGDQPGTVAPDGVPEPT